MEDYNLSQFRSGVVRYEITAEDLSAAILKVAKEIMSEFFLTQEDNQKLDLIPRKKAMEMLNVKTSLTMQRWEEKGYISPYRLGGRIFYKMNELQTAMEQLQRDSIN